MSNTNIIFSPHQDDACLACGGIIAQKSKNKEKTYIVNTCNGRNVFLLKFNKKTNPTPHEVELLRNKEDINAMNHLGIPKNNIYFLGFEDVLMFKQKKEAEKKILELIKKIKPDNVYIPSDTEIHPDHISTYEVVKNCLKRIDFKKPVYEYFVWSRLKIAKKPEQDIILKDIHDVIEQKKEAVKNYKSQIDRYLPDQEVPVLDKKFVDQFFDYTEYFRKIDIYKSEKILWKIYKNLKIRFVSILWARLKI